MKQEQIDRALQQLAPYGFSLSAELRFRKATGIKIVDDGDKLRAILVEGCVVLWTGGAFHDFETWFGKGQGSYTLDAQTGEVHKVLGVLLDCDAKGRYVAKSPTTGSRLWAGTDVSDFVTRYWFAVRIAN